MDISPEIRLEKPFLSEIFPSRDKAALEITKGVLCLLPWLAEWHWLALASFSFGLGEAIIGSSTSAVVADLSREKSLGSAMGVFGTIMDVGHASGPILTGFLIALWGYTGAFSAVAILLFGMTLVFVMTGGVKDNPIQPLPAEGNTSK